MKQEDYNDMMRYPWEVGDRKPQPLPRCPSCGFRYCGDGLTDCTECDYEKNKGQEQ